MVDAARGVPVPVVPVPVAAPVCVDIAVPVAALVPLGEPLASLPPVLGPGAPGAARYALGRDRRPAVGGSMAKYLAIVTYTAEGLKGLVAKGGTARVEASRRFLASAGGSLESFYFALGADDAYIICDLPDNAAAAATAMSAAATGMVVNRMVPLLTAGEVDRAAAAGLAYDAPGS